MIDYFDSYLNLKIVFIECEREEGSEPIIYSEAAIAELILETVMAEEGMLGSNTGPLE